MENIEEKLDVVIDELGYASRTGNEKNKEFYIQNAIRFIEEAKEEIKRYEKYAMYFAGKDKINDIRIAMRDRELDKK